MNPVKLTRGGKWACIAYHGNRKWVVTTSAGTTRTFERYRQAENYAWRMIR